MEQELKRTQIGFRKSDNAFLAVEDVAQLQAAADRLSPQLIRKQLDYWTFLLGPKFSKKERSRMNLSRFYAISQIEYCRNFIFKRNFPIHKIFERSCEIGLWRLTTNRIGEIFGVRLNKRLRGKLATVIDQIEHGHHVFRAYWKHAFLKQYEKFSRYRLTAKGVQVALLFLFFHKRLCGPLANSRFHHKPDPASRPNSQLEAAYHKADKAIENIVDLLQAA